MTARVPVRPELLRWARDRSRIAPERLEKRFRISGPGSGKPSAPHCDNSKVSPKQHEPRSVSCS